MSWRNPKPSTSKKADDSEANVPWSVHAEFRIQRADDNPIQTSSRSAIIVPTTESTGVRMTYTFTPSASPLPSATMVSSGNGSYGFQRGNLMFTSTPPQRSMIPVRSNTIPRYSFITQPRPIQSDSGYNSEQLSTQTIHDKCCKSTCSIVLSNANETTNKQTTSPFPRPWSSYYERHRAVQQNISPCWHFRPVPEICEVCTESARNFQAPHVCKTNLVDEIGTDKVATVTTSKDAASQTTDIEAKLSPVAARRKVRRKAVGGLSSSSGKDEIQTNSINRVSKPPANVKSPSPSTEQTTSDASTTHTTITKEDSSDKRKRTVHIDVYCTGTDDDPNDDEDSDDNVLSASNVDEDDNTEHMTVFENTDLRITHTQAKSSVLPRGFQDEKAFLKRATERRCESFKHAPIRMPSLASSKGYESDDVLSSLYPSQFSSYSRLRDFDSSNPWSAASSSACIAIDEYDSASATSWKDTVSDMESVLYSKTSITPSDSFEYADSLDRERIKRMEAIWAKKSSSSSRTFQSRTWQSPQSERKSLMNEESMKDLVGRHPVINWFSETSSETSDSDEEFGWSFVSSEENASIVQGKLTLESATVVDQTISSHAITTVDAVNQREQLIKQVKTTIYRDRIGPFGSVSQSSTPSKVQSTVTSPFTTPQGEKTDHIVKASIFGRVIHTFRKPGHHVGPAKNPACSCEHCRRHFEELTRARTQPTEPVERTNDS